MNKTLKRYTIIGILFVAILGTLSHFLYEWTGQNPAAAIFSPVNESTWEHIKLLYFPMLLYTLFSVCMLRKEYPCILPAYLLGNIAGCLLIPVIFYTYTGILGFNLLSLDIATFYISVAAAFCTAYYLTLHCPGKFLRSAAYLSAAALFAAFWVFTYFPPEIGLFISPME